MRGLLRSSRVRVLLALAAPARLAYASNSLSARWRPRPVSPVRAPRVPVSSLLRSSLAEVQKTDRASQLAAQLLLWRPILQRNASFPWFHTEFAAVVDRDFICFKIRDEQGGRDIAGGQGLPPGQRVRSYGTRTPCRLCQWNPTTMLTLVAS